MSGREGAPYVCSLEGVGDVWRKSARDETIPLCDAMRCACDHREYCTSRRCAGKFLSQRPTYCTNIHGSERCGLDIDFSETPTTRRNVVKLSLPAQARSFAAASGWWWMAKCFLYFFIYLRIEAGIFGSRRGESECRKHITMTCTSTA